MNKSTKNTAGSPFQDLPISKVFANPDQPRKSFENMEELSSSIERHGVIHPIAVVKVKEKYMIISGERRFRAVKELKGKTIKAHVMDVDAFSVQEMTLVENIQREDLTPFETAMYVNALSYRYETATELADNLGKPASYISKCRSVLNLSELIKIQLASHNHGMSFEVLQELGRVKDEHVQHELFVKKATREEIREVCRKEKEGSKSVTAAPEEVKKVSPAKVEVVPEEPIKKADSHSEHFEYYNMYYGSNQGPESIKESKSGVAGRGIYFDAVSSIAEERGSSLCLVAARDVNFWYTTRNNIPKDIETWNQRLRSSPYHGIIIMSERGAEEEIVIFYPEKITVDREWGTTSEDEAEEVSPAKVETEKKEIQEKEEPRSEPVEVEETKEVPPAKKVVHEIILSPEQKEEGTIVFVDGQARQDIWINMYVFGDAPEHFSPKKKYKITIEEI